MAIKKADIKARLMTGTYVFQSNRAKLNQYSVNPTCLLCGEDPQDLEHFPLKCRALTVTRDPFIKNTINVLNDYLGVKEQQDITRDSNFFVALILDCTAVDLHLSETQRAP